MRKKPEMRSQLPWYIQTFELGQTFSVMILENRFGLFLIFPSLQHHCKQAETKEM